MKRSLLVLAITFGLVISLFAIPPQKPTGRPFPSGNPMPTTKTQPNAKPPTTNKTNPTNTKPGDNIKIVQIGQQNWMQKNLDVDHYRNGDLIPQVKDPSKWSELTTGAWCYFNGDSDMGKVYGKLYNWYAINDKRGLAPKGWHIATDNDWIKLIQYLGGQEQAGGKLKETGTAHWISPNTGATDEAGFTAKPGGFRTNTGKFDYIYDRGFWWTSTQKDTANAEGYFIRSDAATTFRFESNKSLGFSVRCIKD